MIFVLSQFKKHRNGFNCFHFIGFYNGEKIKGIRLKCGNFEADEAYLMALDNIVVKDNILYGKLLKSKKVN